MERKNWEESTERYEQLFEAVNELIRHTTQLAESYKATNMGFAYLIYDKGLFEIMQKSNSLIEYERNFDFMYYNLKGQVEHLKQLRCTLKILQIKDPINCPSN